MSAMHMKQTQKGITLFVALILLVMVTLLAVSSFRVSNTNLKVVSSMQGKSEATAAAQTAIEKVLSSGAFTTAPATYAATPITVDLDGNGTADYTVTLAPIPKCLKARPVNPSDLDINNPADRGCFGSAGPMTSRCSETIWEVAATTTDAVTQAQTTVRQGVSMRVDFTEAANSCK